MPHASFYNACPQFDLLKFLQLFPPPRRVFVQRNHFITHWWKEIKSPRNLCAILVPEITGQQNYNRKSNFLTNNCCQTLVLQDRCTIAFPNIPFRSLDSLPPLMVWHITHSVQDVARGRSNIAVCIEPSDGLLWIDQLSQSDKDIKDIQLIYCYLIPNKARVNYMNPLNSFFSSQA